MANLAQLFNKWEIQTLVLLSFMLQAFLFFAGGLRRRTTNRSLRILVWIAYLGADLVVAYALGLIPRQEDAAASHRLDFVWASFLLIHLGGQDTITGFALEDNNLWRRHLLNLVVQVTLSLYIFWKSANGLNTKVLVTSILLFVAGTIKYGERTWALPYGVLSTLAETSLPHYALQLERTIDKSLPSHGLDQDNQLLEQAGSGKDDDSSSEAIVVFSIALCSIHSARSILWDNGLFGCITNEWVQEHGYLVPKVVLEVLKIELGLLYDYIYTKAVVFQTRGGIILRCMSHTSFVASFVLFLVTNKQRYNSIDTAITYVLFDGGFSLEACSVFTTVMSPWSWAWLKAHHCSFLASIVIRWQRRRVLWSNSMGQYNLHNYLAKYKLVQQQQSRRSWKQGVMAMTRKVVDAVCRVQEKFWISKQLDIKFVKVDKEMILNIFQKVIELVHVDHSATTSPQQWPNLGVILHNILPVVDGTIPWATIVLLHTYTELQLKMYSSSPGDSTGVLVRKLSNYMVYLLVTQPGMLPVVKTTGVAFGGLPNYLILAAAKIRKHHVSTSDGDDCIQSVATEILKRIGLPVPSCCTKGQLLETKEAWINLLIYFAGRSRPEMHAANLAKGGDLLTFVWLLMALKGIKNSGSSRIKITDDLVPARATPMHSSNVLFRLAQRACQPKETYYDDRQAMQDAWRQLMEQVASKRARLLDFW